MSFLSLVICEKVVLFVGRDRTRKDVGGQTELQRDLQLFEPLLVVCAEEATVSKAILQIQ